MPTLSDSQIQTLKNKGLNDSQIKALAIRNGFTMPKDGFFKSLGKSLIQSEKRFANTIAGAIGGVTGAGGKSLIDEANERGERVRNNVIQKIREKREKGEDVTRLVNSLKNLDKDLNFYDILNANTGGSLDKTPGQIFGEGAGVLTDIVGAGALAKGAKTATGAVRVASGFGQGLKAGAKTGALTGAGFSGATSASFAAQEGSGVAETLGAGAGGAIAGGVVGGALGGALGGVGGRLSSKAARSSERELNFMLDFVSPEVTKKAKIAAGKEGRVTDPGLFRPSKITPGRREFELADAVDDVISRKNTVTQNVDSLSNKVTEINNGVIDFVKKNRLPFNTNQLLSRLNSHKDNLRLIFASDRTAERTYNAVVEEFMKHVQKKDTLGLLKARQEIDKVPAIKKLLESEALGENTRREIVVQIRRAANEYIASLLPKGNSFKQDLLRETQLLEALGNAVTKNQSTIGKNKIQILNEKYPFLKFIVGLGLGAGVGAGGAAIGSTD